MGTSQEIFIKTRSIPWNGMQSWKNGQNKLEKFSKKKTGWQENRKNILF
jgi:hypothetical protein